MSKVNTKKSLVIGILTTAAKNLDDVIEATDAFNGNDGFVAALETVKMQRFALDQRLAFLNNSDEDEKGFTSTAHFSLSTASESMLALGVLLSL